MGEDFDDDADEVAALDEALASFAGPEDCMQLSELDGFLTGLALSPEAADPEDWLPWVWGDGIADAAKAARLRGLILDRYERIAADLSDGFGIDPLFWEDEAGNADAADWADGFMAAIDLQPEAWLPILEDASARLRLVPILALAADEEGEPLLRLSAKDMQRLVDEAETLIPEAVEEIRGFWEERRD
jgi:uncharacterized protein